MTIRSRVFSIHSFVPFFLYYSPGTRRKGLALLFLCSFLQRHFSFLNPFTTHPFVLLTPLQSCCIISCPLLLMTKRNHPRPSMIPFPLHTTSHIFFHTHCSSFDIICTRTYLEATVSYHILVIAIERAFTRPPNIEQRVRKRKQIAERASVVVVATCLSVVPLRRAGVVVARLRLRNST
ncbi:hypothetical protein BC629DRAFT_598926 [Irpex lacteus]|nr:hypothetical protein BC629DRAFT_598926 [Irpex lacteus]